MLMIVKKYLLLLSIILEKCMESIYWSIYFMLYAYMYIEALSTTKVSRGISIFRF